MKLNKTFVTIQGKKNAGLTLITSEKQTIIKGILVSRFT
jgi:hypothetical protein